MIKIVAIIVMALLISSCSFGKKDVAITPGGIVEVEQTETPEDTDIEITTEEEDNIVNETMAEIEDIFNLLESEDVQ